jgi:hypothetical protein
MHRSRGWRARNALLRDSRKRPDAIPKPQGAPGRSLVAQPSPLPYACTRTGCKLLLLFARLIPVLGRADERTQLPHELPPHHLVLLIALEPHLLLNVVDCLALARLGQLKCAFERCYVMVHETATFCRECPLFNSERASTASCGCLARSPASKMSEAFSFRRKRNAAEGINAVVLRDPAFPSFHSRSTWTMQMPSCAAIPRPLPSKAGRAQVGKSSSGMPLCPYR